MNTIGFEVRAPVEPWHATDIVIDGRDLRDLVREVEQAFADAEGHPDIAGKYIGILAAPQYRSGLPADAGSA